MKKLILTIVCVLFAGSLASGQELDPVTKWLQFPMLDPSGVDVNATFPLILADDFLCENPGPLTDFSIWGSWLGDYLPFGGDPTAVGFRLSIHSDIPAGVGGLPFSRPGDLLWERYFNPGDFQADPFEFVPEGWYEPWTGVYMPEAAAEIWLYDFRVPVIEAFFQQGMPDAPIVYWLDVSAEPFDESAFFGWKNSWDTWNDAAVWTADEMMVEPWLPLVHPEMGGQLDMAFEIRGLCAGDTTGDGFVGGGDLNIILGNWGMIGASRGQGDLTGDGFVGGGDYNEVLSYWGLQCPYYPGPEEPPVPEPTALMFLLPAGALVFRRRNV